MGQKYRRLADQKLGAWVSTYCVNTMLRTEDDLNQKLMFFKCLLNFNVEARTATTGGQRGGVSPNKNPPSPKQQ